MDNLNDKIELAKTNTSILNKLITEYQPFIKKEISKSVIYDLEYDDRLSIAMLVFMNCVYQYNEEKGNFLSFLSVSIKNRLIDEGRKLKRQISTIPFEQNENNENEILSLTEEKASLYEYSKEEEQRRLKEEINVLSSILSQFHIDFSTLETICPKQKRSRHLCISLGKEIVSNEKMRLQLLKHHRISQSELAKKFKISEKTIEKHRKYIVVIAIILTGDFPSINAFLPETRR